MSFIILDTEYTAWKGCQENGWQGNQKKEIVQIAALKVSNNLKVLAEFNALCKPKINPVLSEYFTNLTHITNTQIKKHGEPFADVYKRFEVFVKNNICYSHSWGSGFLNESDGSIIKENLYLQNLIAEKKIVYRNVAPIFKQLYKENNISVKSQCCGEIAGILGVDKKLIKSGRNPHNALYDVYSILEGLKYFYPRSVELMNLFMSHHKNDD